MSNVTSDLVRTIRLNWAGVLLVIGALAVGAHAQPPSPLPAGGQPPAGRGGRGGFGPGSALAVQMFAQGDQDKDQKLTKDEFVALADAWFDKLDTDKAGQLTSQQFSARFGELVQAAENAPRGEQPGGRRGAGRGRGGRGRGSLGDGLFTVIDADKNGSLTRAELKSVFEKWAADFDSDKGGSLNQDKLVAGLNAALPRPTGGGRGQPAPDDDTGFVPIFDGKSLAGWDGDPTFWRAENDEIIGESTAEKRVQRNNFLIWQAGVTKDFELKLEYKISDGANSGVQYRSALVPDAGKWVLRGYQADMDSQNQFTGMIYEERGRGFLAPRGQFARVAADGRTRLIGAVGESEALRASIKAGDWNQLHVIARGGTIMQVINGQLMSALVDEHETGRALEGLLGLQIHTGPPMKLQFRKILLKKL